MGSTKRLLEEREQERYRKQEALLDAPKILSGVVEKLQEISDSLNPRRAAQNSVMALRTKFVRPS